MTDPTPKHKEETRELLPCPFCGGAAILGMFNVWCSKCQAATDKDVDASADEIIQRWNTRALSSRDTEIREVLEGLAWQLDLGDIVEMHWGHSIRANCTSACLATKALYEKVTT